ncbi:serine/threonine protein kinase [Lentzea atacamensis]|uniref:Serine/threonine protein kinase n=1 Tax=Lentzea atacamensis TaxID=531938 RepID=A0A316HR89_9PSEU|nr:serine/threonine-protein kinase [Lentzea atacamensis]PWK80805.1 serine/threonine protein kinase [Lentzea atacamensis]
MTQELPEIPGFRYVRRLSRNVRLYREFGGDREVAVKALEDAPRTNELRAVVALGSPGVATVHRAGRTRFGLVYLVMKYYSNGDLTAAAPLPADRVLEIGVRAADALHAAHEVGIVHRDVKPANILLDEHGDPVLTGFGVRGRDSLPWTAPEVVNTGHHNVATDVFSLGATLWHLLTGHSPFLVPHRNNSRSAIEARIVRGSPRPTGRAPRSLEELLCQTMATNRPHAPRPRRSSPPGCEQSNARRRRGDANGGGRDRPGRTRHAQAFALAGVRHGRRGGGCARHECDLVVPQGLSAARHAGRRGRAAAARGW